MNLGDMTTNKFRVENNGLYTKIFINDKEIPRIREFSLYQSVGSIPTLILEMIPEIETIELNGEIIYNYYDIDGNKLVIED
jgi:hypothetical protein